MTQWEKGQRFGARVAHRIKITEKINRGTKERHAAEMAAYGARSGPALKNLSRPKVELARFLLLGRLKKIFTSEG
jgi:hypothetical protein